MFGVAVLATMRDLMQQGPLEAAARATLGDSLWILWLNITSNSSMAESLGGHPGGCVDIMGEEFWGVLGWFEVGPIARGMHPKWRGKDSKSKGVMGCREVSQAPWHDSACARVGADTQCQDQPWEHPEGHGDTLQDTKRPCRTRPQDLGDFSHSRGGGGDIGGRTGTHRTEQGHTEG